MGFSQQILKANLNFPHFMIIQPWAHGDIFLFFLWSCKNNTSFARSFFTFENLP